MRKAGYLPHPPNPTNVILIWPTPRRCVQPTQRTHCRPTNVWRRVCRTTYPAVQRLNARDCTTSNLVVMHLETRHNTKYISDTLTTIFFNLNGCHFLLHVHKNPQSPLCTTFDTFVIFSKRRKFLHSLCPSPSGSKLARCVSINPFPFMATPLRSSQADCFSGERDSNADLLSCTLPGSPVEAVLVRTSRARNIVVQKQRLSVLRETRNRGKEHSSAVGSCTKLSITTCA